jgi:hypothetical protein
LDGGLCRGVHRKHSTWFTTQHYCAKCGSEQIRRNGRKNGQLTYQGLFVPAAMRRMAQYTQVNVLLGERHLQRSIARAIDVARAILSSG